jgi:integrase
MNAREWQSIWDASYSDNYPYGHFTRALMLSGQRLSNVAQMRWDEIEGDIWTIPRDKFKATRTEKAKAHEVPMSFALQALIQTIPKTSSYVFSLRYGKPITAGSRQKDRIARLSNVADWTYHDIRRTGATRMAEGRVPRFIVERVLGHADKGVTAVYDRASYRDEKKQALEVLAASINDAVPNNVIGISSKAPK